MHARIFRSTALLILGFLYQLDTAEADPVTITSGFAMVEFGGDPVHFSIAGDDFAASGRWSVPSAVPALVCGSGCGPGQIMTLSTTLENLIVQTAPVELVAAGSATVNGTTFSTVEFIGTLGFLTPSITLPSLPAEPGGVTVSAPFTFGGVLQGWNPLTRDGTLLFTQELNGSGEATLTLLASPTSFTFGTLRYDFAPTPEPATFALLASAFAATGLVYRRRSSS